MVFPSNLEGILKEYMKSTLRGILNRDDFKIECHDRYGFTVCQTKFPSDGTVDFDVTRDWVSNGVDLPSNVKDFVVNNIFVKEGNYIRYFVIVYWGDLSAF